MGLQAEIEAAGRELAGAFPSAARHPLRTLDEKAMELTSQDAELRAALFRFVDVVPACRGVDDLARHLAGFLDEVPDRPAPLDAALRMADSRAGRAALGTAAAAGVKHMAHRFIVGETPREVVGLLRTLWRRGVATSVDLLGEATVTTAEADRYAERCSRALEELSAAHGSWPPRPILEADSAGPLPRANLSVKVSALTPLLRPDAPERGKRDAEGRLRALLAQARDLQAHLHIDMESLDSRDAVLDLVLELLSDPEFADGPSSGLVLQAYLRDSPGTLDRVLEWARATPRASPLTVRLVKGAYWDHEVIEARQHGWPAPVFEDKADCDRNFEDLTRRLLDARPSVRVAIASHNLRSVAHALAWHRRSGRDDADLELQVLRGLGDDLQDALAASGLRVRTYCPVGDLVAGMAYLVRRLLENTANDSFLVRQSHGAPLQTLLAAP
ncbi:MAG: proline dehydrogenase [Solirubrobacteraceae bacterium]|jgi:RHH-type proline utilization regulon transcriptional repressor/proline dehydrogenase/delta 1-pyrroline-5-carboxylate dehydrogenase|nr:proline dehydrogenase [Solirubrobacteraceae bacterium]